MIHGKGSNEFLLTVCTESSRNTVLLQQYQKHLQRWSAFPTASLQDKSAVRGNILRDIPKVCTTEGSTLLVHHHDAMGKPPQRRAETRLAAPIPVSVSTPAQWHALWHTPAVMLAQMSA